MLAGGDVNGGVVGEEDVMDCEVVQSDVEVRPVEEPVELAVEGLWNLDVSGWLVENAELEWIEVPVEMLEWAQELEFVKVVVKALWMK